MKGLQIALALDAPEPIEARREQRNAERDRALDGISGVREELIKLADPIALRVAAEQDGCTGPRLLLAMRAAGYGEMLDAIDSRWVAGVLLPSRGWVAVGLVNEGSKSRPVKLWRRAV